MTPREFYEQMQQIRADEDLSNDDKHERMDTLMCKLLADMGYTDGIEVFRSTKNGIGDPA